MNSWCLPLRLVLALVPVLIGLSSSVHGQVAPPGAGVLEGTTMLNLQTGLREQTLRLTNNTTATVPAYNIIVRGLPDGVEVYNASTRRADGSWVVNVLQPMTPFSTRDIVLEYFSANRLPASLTPEITTEVVLNPPDRTANGAGAFAIDRALLLPGPPLRILLEFTTIPTAVYRVQYSNDGNSWQDSPIPIRAAGTRVQWIDRGPPATDSPPAAGGTRFYRVKQVPRKGDRINLNYVLRQGEQGRAFLTALFRLWGIQDNQQADDLFDNLLDWTDADSLSHHNGWEKEQYQVTYGATTTYPFNRLFYGPDEMVLVEGFDAITTRVPDWRDYFTVYSQGKVDFNAAAPKVLAAVATAIDNPGDPVAHYNRLLEPGQGARAVVLLRSGVDGVEGTNDDTPMDFNMWAEISTLLDIPMPNANGDFKAQLVNMIFGFNQ